MTRDPVNTTTTGESEIGQHNESKLPGPPRPATALASGDVQPRTAAVAVAEAEADGTIADPLAGVPQTFIIDGTSFPCFKGQDLNTFMHADNFLEACCEHSGAFIVTGVLDGNVRVDIYGRCPSICCPSPLYYPTHHSLLPHSLLPHTPLPTHHTQLTH
jgi:hypothetical protein